jgi:hypothetical protein
MEEDADFRIERRAARNHRLEAAAEARRDLGAQEAVQQHVHRPVPERHRARIVLAPDVERALHQVAPEAPLLLDVLEDALPKHFEQARHDDHDRRLHLLDVGGELLDPFGIIDLAAERDREHLAARMLVGVARR